MPKDPSLDIDTMLDFKIAEFILNETRRIIPSFTFIATANAVNHTGAITWLMDIDPNSWTLDARQLESELVNNAEYRDGVLIHRSSEKRIEAIMPVLTDDELQTVCDSLRKILML